MNPDKRGIVLGAVGCSIVWATAIVIAVVGWQQALIIVALAIFLFPGLAETTKRQP